jgi:site-specific DNA recombinase
MGYYDADGRVRPALVPWGGSVGAQAISARTKEKAEWRAQKGLKNGGQVLGYDIDPKNPGVPTVNGAEKQLVRLICETYVKIKGLRRTAEEINRKGYRTKSYTSRRGKHQGDNRFSDMAVRRILTNKFYIGLILHRDECHDGRHESIVSTELFENVQRILDGNRGKRGRPQERHLFNLDGLVRCGSRGEMA